MTVTPEEAARRLRVTVKTVYAWAARPGGLRASRLGRRILFHETVIADAERRGLPYMTLGPARRGRPVTRLTKGNVSVRMSS